MFAIGMFIRFNIRTYMRPLWGRDSIFTLCAINMGSLRDPDFIDYHGISKVIDAGGITCL